MVPETANSVEELIPTPINPNALLATLVKVLPINVGLAAADKVTAKPRLVN